MHTAVATEDRRRAFAQAAPNHSWHGILFARRRMIVKTLGGRFALWTVAIVSGALVLFGSGAAWNLRKQLIKNLDNEIAIEGRDLISEIEEQRLDWSSRKSAEAFLKEESNLFR